MRNKNKESNKVSIGGWMGTLILSGIPGINLIMWIIWAISAKKPSRRSFAAACLILTAIFLAAAAVVISLFGTEILEWARQIDPELFKAEAVG